MDAMNIQLYGLAMQEMKINSFYGCGDMRNIGTLLKTSIGVTEDVRIPILVLLCESGFRTNLEKEGILMSQSMNRRTFLKGAALTGALASVAQLGIASAMADEAAEVPSSSLHSWEIVPDPISDDLITETTDVDIVVIGAGAAGCSAFCYAAEQGASVVMLEKLDGVNGRGLDVSGIGTKIQEENGIEVDKGQIMSDLIKASGYKANGALIKLWADQSGAALNRLIDDARAAGVEPTPGMGSKASADAPDFASRTYPTDHMFGPLVEGIVGCLQRLTDAGVAAGGKTLFGVKAEQLIREDEGRVSGVIVSQGDKYIKFNVAKGVILATGDYGNNPEMVDAFCPLAARAESNVYPHPECNTGDGINMACWIGAAVSPEAHAAMIHPIFGGGAMSTAAYMKVNDSGIRFCNESTTLPGVSNMYLCSRNRKVWSIFDSNFEEQMPNMTALSNYNNQTAGPMVILFASGEADPTNPPTPTEMVKYAMEELGTTFEGETLEELAEAIDVPSENLIATVNRYNECVDAGVDMDFGKMAADLQPIKVGPFYASALTARVLAIASGLEVNSDMQVLDITETPIEGLYAVGNVMSNFFANDYPITCPGLSHGRCFTLGALIGKAVATDATVQTITL